MKGRISITESAPTPRGGSVDKIEKFGWTSVGNPGVLRMINKNDIEVDPDYQREASVGRIRAIASRWVWMACGALVVSERDGRYWVVDGQHRLLAAKSRKDIQELPCVVYQASQRLEAEGFLDLNGGKAPSALAKFHASLAAGNETSIYVQSIYDQLGLTPEDTGRPGSIKCVGLAWSLASLDRECFRTVMTFVAELCGRETQVGERVLSGIDYLHKHCGQGLRDGRLRARLLAAGPHALLEGAARAAGYYARGGAKVFAQGMLDVVNKGLRVRYELDQPKNDKSTA